MLKEDRELGEYWEQVFCRMAVNIGKMVTPMQLNHAKSVIAFFGNRYVLLPDIVIWTYPGEYHEVKHKAPTKYGSFGLEKYRFEALLEFAGETKQDVMYTIHNHALNGGRENRSNYIRHWFTANISDLDNKWSIKSNGSSWCGGIKKVVPIYYWKISLWHSLFDIWFDKK